MTRHARIVATSFALTLAMVVAAGCRSQSEPPRGASTAAAASPARGGAATASIRIEPATFNRLMARDASTDLLATLTQAKLVRINKVTQDVDPWLAESWKTDEPGRRYTLTLRDGVRFSDGHPFTADDVLFTFQAVYDAKTHSALADAMMVAGKPLQVAAPDARTVSITFPSAFAPGLRLLDNLPILPKHKLETALKAGTLASAWSLSTPPDQLTGLGPFMIREYLPGQRIMLERNPNYWRKDANGTALPYLDRLTLERIPDQNAELLRLQAGQLDITASEVPPEMYAATKRARDEGAVKLYDLGVGLAADSFWFNLKPGAFANDPRATWLQRDELRRAISMAVDRRLFADTVYFGAGEPVDGPVTPSNKKWYSPDVPKVPHDPEGAKKLLAGLGLFDRNGDGLIDDGRGEPLRFTLVTQKGRPRLERGAAVVREELKKIGLTMDVAALDGGAVIERIVTAKYDAVFFSPQATDLDPGMTPDFWFSSGAAHLWNMGQTKPATDWERRIDELMTRQIASPDENERRKLFADVLTIFAEHQPVLYFAAPKLFVATASRIVATPAIDIAPVLWLADSVAVTGNPSSTK